MQLWNVTPLDVCHVVDDTSRVYGNNLTFNREPGQGPSGRGPVRFTLRVKSSHGPGARRGPSGRRSVAACWHAHRDTMRALFGINPAARLKTAITDYRGLADFEEKFVGTGNKNTGSRAYPAVLADACDCFTTRTAPKA